MADILLLDGENFKEADVEFDNSFYNPPGELEPIIDSAWSELLQKGVVWDGIIYRLDSIRKRSGKIMLLLNKIKYRYHVTSHIYGKLLHEFKHADRPNGIYVAAYIRTSDNFLLFSQKSKESILQTSYNLIGGNCNEDEQVISSVYDFFVSWKNELTEELSISEKYISNWKHVGLYQTDRYRVAAIFIVDLDLSAEDTRKKVKLNFEHDKIFFIHANEFSKLSNLACYANIVASSKPRINSYLTS